MSKPKHTSIPSELQDALAEKPAEEQERMRQVWHLLGHLDVEDFDTTELNIPNTEEALADLESVLDAPSNPRIHSFAADRPARAGGIHQKSRAMQWTTSMASLCVVLFLVMIWYWRVPVAFVAPLGEHVTIVLPDQSVITLNSGSRIEYPRRFESGPLFATTKRRVHLQGEAFFEIQKMEKPFVVETFNAQVRVLGTSFNVWSREHDVAPETRVTLESGRVAVTQHDNFDDDVTLDENLLTTLSEPGQMIRVVTGDDGIVENIRGEIALNRMSAWRSKGLSATEYSIASIVAEIERQHAITIRLDDAIDASEKMTLYIKEKPSVEALIEDVCLSIGCQYRPTSNGFHIFPAGTN